MTLAKSQALHQQILTLQMVETWQGTLFCLFDSTHLDPKFLQSLAQPQIRQIAALSFCLLRGQHGSFCVVKENSYKWGMLRSWDAPEHKRYDQPSVDWGGKNNESWDTKWLDLKAPGHIFLQRTLKKTNFLQLLAPLQTNKGTNNTPAEYLSWFDIW